MSNDYDDQKFHEIANLDHQKKMGARKEDKTST